MEDRKYIFGLSSVTLVIILGALAKFTLHILTGAKYGFFVDELYTIALSKHLAFGYVDLPPLVPLLTALSRILFGELLTAWHILPALAGAVTLVFVCLIAKEFGGKLFAVGLSALGFFIAPVWLILHFDLSDYDTIKLSWLFTICVGQVHAQRKPQILDLVRGNRGHRLPDENDHSVSGWVFWLHCCSREIPQGFAFTLAWLGAALCLLIVSPYLIWQVDNDLLMLKYWIGYGTIRLQPVSIQKFTLDMLYSMNPALLPVYAIGLWRIFRRFGKTNYGFLGVMFLATLAQLFLLHAKTWMLAELFMPLIAAGAVGLEEMTDGRSWGKILKPSLVTAMLAGGVLMAPSSLPILTIEF